MPPPIPSDETSPGGRPRWQLAAAVVGVVALLVATIVVFVSGGDDDADDAASVTTTTDPGGSATTQAPSSSTTPPDQEPVSEAEFLALVDELKAYVAEARGLDFLSEVVVELEDDEAFEARLLRDFEEDAAEVAESEVFYRALGLLEGEESLLDILRGIFSAGVLGFYDTESNELVVRGKTPTPYVQKTIVHELVHALDDQHFELFRPQYDDRKDEIASGMSAVVEGNARRIENEWFSEQPADFREQADAEERAFADGIDLSGFPEILLFQIGAPYELGETFVGTLLRGGGERSVDAALTDPPDTSEQFLFPPLYDQREPRVEVPVPPADGEIVDDGVVGALFLFGLFTTGGSTVNSADAFRAVQGWGGDWAVTWTDGDVACVRADFVGDTDGDTDEIENTLSAWADGRDGGAQVGRVDGRVRLESCGGGAGAVPPQV